MISIDTSFRAALFATAAFACASGAAIAADTQAAWEGVMENTGSSGCGGVGGAALGDTHVSVYRPHVNPTDTATYLAIVFTRAEFTLKNNSETIAQMNGNGTYTATVIDGRGEPGTYSGSFSIAVTPFPVKDTTPVVTVKGTIHNYFNVSACTVTFTATYGIE
jgi:hypothetical protein